MAKGIYTHFMQRVDIPGQNVLDIEEEFTGLRYLKADGINNIGESKNVYTEEYADSDRLRYYLPSDNNYANKATTITMTFVVIGNSETRQGTIDNFYSYIRKGVHRYWDDARNREFDFVVTEQIKVSDERWYGSQPYVEIEIPLQNLNGSTRPH